MRSQIAGQTGVALPFLAISAAALLGFVALVVDVGRLALVRTELQSAADACALSAVADLDRTQGQLNRAQMSGQFAAARLPVAFQQPATGANATTVEVRFATALNGAWVSAANVSTSAQSTNYRAAECRVSHPGVTTFFGQAIGASVDGVVTATARAVGVPSTRACVFPVALEAPLGAGRTWGLVPNTVYYPVKPTITIIPLLFSITTADYNLRLVDFTVPAGNTTGASNATLIAQISTGLCDIDMTTRTNQRAPLLTSAAQLDTAWAPWNARFGVYNTGSSLIPSTGSPTAGVLPDITGWAPDPPGLLAVNGLGALLNTPLTIAPEGGLFDIGGSNYQANAALRSVMPASARPNNFSPSPAAGNHRELGASGRRLVILPVTRPASNGNGQMRNVVDYACGLLYRPIGQDNFIGILGQSITYRLSWAVEFIGFANDPASPCRSQGMPGSSASLGPLVPVLAQ